MVSTKIYYFTLRLTNTRTNRHTTIYSQVSLLRLKVKSLHNITKSKKELSLNYKSIAQPHQKILRPSFVSLSFCLFFFVFTIHSNFFSSPSSIFSFALSRFFLLSLLHRDFLSHCQRRGGEFKWQPWMMEGWGRRSFGDWVRGCSWMGQDYTRTRTDA